MKAGLDAPYSVFSEHTVYTSVMAFSHCSIVSANTDAAFI
jgi:hypothetical protein